MMHRNPFPPHSRRELLMFFIKLRGLPVDKAALIVYLEV